MRHLSMRTIVAVACGATLGGAPVLSITGLVAAHGAQAALGLSRLGTRR